MWTQISTQTSPERSHTRSRALSPSLCIAQISSVQYHTAHPARLDPELVYLPTVYLQAQTVEVLPQWFEGSVKAGFPLVRTHVTSGCSRHNTLLQFQRVENSQVPAATFSSTGSDLTVAQIDFVLGPVLKVFPFSLQSHPRTLSSEQETRFLPVTVLELLARLGAIVATIYAINFLIRKLNFLHFYAKCVAHDHSLPRMTVLFRADSSYFVPDQETREFVLRGRNSQVNHVRCRSGLVCNRASLSASLRPSYFMRAPSVELNALASRGLLRRTVAV